MNSREEFLKSLKVNENNNANRQQRYKSNVKARDMVKKKKLHSRVVSLFMAGFIAGVCTTGAYKYFSDSKPEPVANKTQITMMNETQSALPENVFFHNKADYEELQKNIAEYKQLDDIFFKNDNEKKRFSQLQEFIGDKDKLVEQIYLNLVKQKIAETHGIQNPSNLTIRPNSVDGSPRHIVYNETDNTKIFYDQLGETVLNAISDIANFQSKRGQQGQNIPLKDTLKIKSIKDLHTYAVTDYKLMSEIVVSLNDSMMKFSKTINKDKNSKEFNEGR